MKWTHLSNWDQEEYVLGQRTPAMVRHLAQCSACQAGVASLEEGIGIFRTSAMQWSADCIEARAGTGAVRPVAVRSSFYAYGWALALVILLIAVFPLYHLATRNLKPQQHIAAKAAEAPMSDDALLQQVDDEVSVAVPSSMEPLTHLVATRNVNAASSTGGLPRAQTN